MNQVQVFALLAGQVPSHRVAMLLKERGIDFKPQDDPTLQIIYVLFAESLFPLYASFMWNLLPFTCEGTRQTRGGSDGKRLCQRLLDVCRSFDVRRGASGRGT
jgi:hypothetical protein